MRLRQIYSVQVLDIEKAFHIDDKIDWLTKLGFR